MFIVFHKVRDNEADVPRLTADCPVFDTVFFAVFFHLDTVHAGSSGFASVWSASDPLLGGGQLRPRSEDEERSVTETRHRDPQIVVVLSYCGEFGLYVGCCCCWASCVYVLAVAVACLLVCLCTKLSDIITKNSLTYKLTYYLTCNGIFCWMVLLIYC